MKRFSYKGGCGIEVFNTAKGTKDILNIKQHCMHCYVVLSNNGIIM